MWGEKERIIFYLNSSAAVELSHIQEVPKSDKEWSVLSFSRFLQDVV